MTAEASKKLDSSSLTVSLGLACLGVFTLASVLPEASVERYGFPAVVESTPFGGVIRSVSRVSSALALALSFAVLVHRLSFLGSRSSASTGAVKSEMSQAKIWFPYVIAWLLSASFGAAQGAASYALVCIAMAVASFLIFDRQIMPESFDAIARWPIRLVIILSLVVAVLVPGRAYAPYEVWPGGWFEGVDRLQGLLPHPNTLAWVAAVGVAVELWGARSKITPVFIAASVLALILSGSRTASIALFVGLVAAATFGVSKRQMRLFWKVLAPTVLGASLLLAVASGVSAQSFNGRQVTWLAAWEAFSANWLLGSGPGAYLVTDGTVASVPYAHNQVLQTGAELGFVGLVALGIHVISLVTYARHADSALGYCLLAMWLAMFISENLLRFAATSFFPQIFFFQLALYLATQGTRRSLTLGSKEYAP